MKNTIENAKAFLTKYRDERTHPVSVDYFAEMMTAYANSVRPEVVVPKKREINYDDPIMFQKKDETWNICIDRIKSLNPTLTFTELNHTEK